jgi:hypothetical protein
MELSDCDASETIIRDAHSCSVQVSILINEPFSLTWGSSVVAKVVAYNLYGDSLISESGNGAVIITYADAPVNLKETISARTASSISFSWTSGFNNGGSSVTDYRVSYDGATGIYSELASGVTTTHYTATGLTAGKTYKFKVQAQNGFGFSEYSEEVAILCATSPEKPNTPSTTVVTDYVVFNWDAPVDNGSPITSYHVFIRKADLSFIEDPTVCDG